MIGDSETEKSNNYPGHQTPARLGSASLSTMGLQYVTGAPTPGQPLTAAGWNPSVAPFTNMV